MKPRQLKIIRIIAGVLVSLFLLGASSQCFAKTGAALEKLSRGSTEAESILRQPVAATELNVKAQNLDALIAEVPDKAALSDEERRILEQAVRQAEALRELGRMLGLSDSIVASISNDAVTLALGSLVPNPSPALVARLEATVSKLLKDTMCSAFSDVMSAETKAEAAKRRANFTYVQPDSMRIQSALEVVAETQGFLEELRGSVYQNRLASQMLSTVSGYVDRLSKTLTAASWQNAGAFQAYIRHCVS